MKYWITIQGSLPEEVAKELWNKISWTNANLTVLFDRAYIYGTNGSDDLVSYLMTEANRVTNCLVERG